MYVCICKIRTPSPLAPHHPLIDEMDIGHVVITQQGLLHSRHRYPEPRVCHAHHRYMHLDFERVSVNRFILMQ